MSTSIYLSNHYSVILSKVFCWRLTNQRKMATSEWYFTLNGVFLEDFSALSTCILSGDEVNNLERILGQDGEIGLATTRINYFGWISLSWFHIEEKPTTPLGGRRSQECGAASLGGGESAGNWRQLLEDRSEPTESNPPPKPAHRQQLSHQGESCGYSWIYLLGNIKHFYVS